MRVISGEYRSRILKSLPGLDSRPTLAKVKGAVFNHLGSLQNKSFLDLFCGCGNIGIEALSRGAAIVCFNDNNPQAIKVLQSNLDLLKIDGRRAKVSSWHYRAFLSKQDEPFDFIYLDPPFELNCLAECLGLIAERGLLKEDGELIIESEGIIAEDYPRFELLKTARYGRIRVAYYRNGN